MKILVTGKGTSGSWRMRGVQLGQALGATVEPMAAQRGFDLAVVVKRVPDALLAGLKRWVWDIVDAYKQPAAYSWTRADAIAWCRWELARLKPAAVIWPTQRMREDCDNGLPGIVIPHHCRAGLAPGANDLQLVGYEGAPPYLGRWHAVIEAACAARGLRFVVNPPDYQRLGTVIAMRDGGGYVCTHWKSGVKHSNALAIGARFIGHPECGYMEQATGGERWATTAKEIGDALDNAMPLVGQPYTVQDAAAELRPFLHAL